LEELVYNPHIGLHFLGLNFSAKGLISKLKEKLCWLWSLDLVFGRFGKLDGPDLECGEDEVSVGLGLFVKVIIGEFNAEGSRACGVDFEGALDGLR